MNEPGYTFMLAGNSPYANRGCEAIVRGTTAILRHEFGENCRFFSAYFHGVGCRDAENEADPAIIHVPAEVSKRFDLAWFQRKLLRVLSSEKAVMTRFRPFREPLEQCDAVLMVGGDNYTFDYGKPSLFFTLNRFVASHAKPFALWGASVGPFSKDPEYERWAAKELQRVPLICVRETATRQYLESIGVVDNVKLVADPAFWLQPAEVELPLDVETALSDGCVGLNLSPLLARFYTDFPSWIAHAEEIVRHLLQTLSLPILLVPHVTPHSRGIRRDDYLFMREVTQKIDGGKGQLLLLEPNYDAAQTKWIISRLRVFAGARTHSTLAAISSGVPTVCLSYSIKAQGIAKDVYGHSDWLLDGASFDAVQFSDRLAALLREEESVRAHLRQRVPLLRERAAKAAQYVRELIEEGG